MPPWPTSCSTRRAACAPPIAKAVWCCDPVLGDVDTGIYVKPGIDAFFRERAIPAADLVTPNHFELEHLTGRKVSTMAEALAAARSLLERPAARADHQPAPRRRAGRPGRDGRGEPRRGVADRDAVDRFRDRAQRNGRRGRRVVLGSLDRERRRRPGARQGRLVDLRRARGHPAPWASASCNWWRRRIRLVAPTRRFTAEKL